DASPTMLGPVASPEARTLSGRLGQVEPTLDHGHAQAAIAMAARVADAAPGFDPVVHVFTDLQASQWQGVDIALPHTIHVFPEAARSNRQTSRLTDNVALRWMTVTPSAPIAGEPIIVAVEVVNFGPSEADVTIVLDGLSSF